MLTSKPVPLLSILVASAAAAVPAQVSAQSAGVTLFGIVDAMASRYRHDTASVTRLGSGGHQASRIGVRGQEDLGGGLRASFWLEADVNLDSGAGGSTNANNQQTGTGPSTGLMFNRRSTVSLHAPSGEWRFGRDYTPTFWNFAMFDPFIMQGVASGSNLFFAGTPGPALGTIRNSNSIGYLYNTTQPFGMSGPFFQWQSAFGENASGTANQDDGDYHGFRTGYAAGPAVIAVAYSHWEHLASRNFTLASVGASWAHEVAKVMATYHVAKSGIAGTTFKTASIGATILLGSGYVPLSLIRTNRDNAAEAKATQLAVGYVYNLSRQTALYTSYARLRNKNGANFAIGGNVPFAAPANATSSGIDVGVRHVF